ncbi:hypothetical protein [Solidesulfovibrio sp.]|jgi:outer membrane PBP1 activator LpoA protein|uniref:hypothetical protein n=1 Tax=Solidesulfovibrio sp. TaxID=2910990 RepID=UPI002B217F11|nr:hypothetical protein [Solidesulfovibrio sp.]MEA5088510.1 hypothetical protein [Solidesulfovibrio sp.]HML60936.1 hypothetical protein [Solidesulfovibrio sp.]
MQKALFSFPRPIVCLCALLLGLALFGCSSKIVHEPGQVLAEKVKSQEYAYMRYSQAEEDARRDGNAEAAERYRQAKETALDQYKRYEQELTQYQSQRASGLSK